MCCAFLMLTKQEQRSWLKIQGARVLLTHIMRETASLFAKLSHHFAVTLGRTLARPVVDQQVGRCGWEILVHPQYLTDLGHCGYDLIPKTKKTLCDMPFRTEILETRSPHQKHLQ